MLHFKPDLLKIFVQTPWNCHSKNFYCPHALPDTNGQEEDTLRDIMWYIPQRPSRSYKKIKSATIFDVHKNLQDVGSVLGTTSVNNIVSQFFIYLSSILFSMLPFQLNI